MVTWYAVFGTPAAARTHPVSDAGEELNRERAVADRLAELNKPVLVVWGEKDVLTPTPPNVTRYGAAGLTPRVIAGSGHSPMIETPEAFLAKLADFIRPAPASN
jgi:pimeloyl-ACP methyl ester carboxylesterase